MTKIPRAEWHDYLGWLQKTVGVGVTHDAEVFDIEPLADDLFAVHATIAGRRERLLARHVVLATGIEGAGRWLVPPAIAAALPRERYAHTAEAIDFSALAGKRVAVIGAGASAFDNAAEALEAGAAGVALYARRRSLPKANPNRYIEFSGYNPPFRRSRRRREMGGSCRAFFAMNQPPPQDTFERCARFDGFALHLGSPVEQVSFADDAIVIESPAGRARATTS